MTPNYFAFNGSSFFRGNASNIGYAFTGMPTQMPSLSPANYAVFKYGANTLSFPRVNYQIGGFGSNSNMLRFKKGGYDSGLINTTNTSNVNSLLSGIGSHFKITGVIELFGPAVEEEAAKKKPKNVEEIINLILNYGAKAVEIAQGLGILKAKNQTDDGWGNIDGLGLGTGDYNPEQYPQEKPLPTDNGSTILGFKTENVLIATGLGAAAIALLKK